MSDEHSDNLDKIYRDYRRQILDALERLSASFAKYLLTFSGGAIGLSLTVVVDLRDSFGLTSLIFVGLGWSSLVAAIICIIQSISTSMRAHVAFVEAVDKPYGMNQEDFLDIARKRQDDTRLTQRVNALNSAATFLFVLGLGLVLIATIVAISSGKA